MGRGGQFGYEFLPLLIGLCIWVVVHILNAAKPPKDKR